METSKCVNIIKNTETKQYIDNCELSEIFMYEIKVLKF